MFFEQLQRTWNEIGIDVTAKLVDSMNRHLMAVIKAKGVQLSINSMN